MWYFAVKISIPNCECHCNALTKFDFMAQWKEVGKQQQWICQICYMLSLYRFWYVWKIDSKTKVF